MPASQHYCQEIRWNKVQYQRTDLLCWKYQGCAPLPWSTDGSWITWFHFPTDSDWKQPNNKSTNFKKSYCLFAFTKGRYQHFIEEIPWFLTAKGNHTIFHSTIFPFSAHCSTIIKFLTFPVAPLDKNFIKPPSNCNQIALGT